MTRPEMIKHYRDRLQAALRLGRRKEAIRLQTRLVPLVNQQLRAENRSAA